MHQEAVLVALCEAGPTAELQLALAGKGYRPLSADSISEALKRAEAHTPRSAVIGMARGRVSALQLARHLRQHDAAMPLVLLVSASSENLAIEALRAGFNDYLLASQSLHQVVTVLSGVDPRGRPRGSPAPVPAGTGGAVSSCLLGDSASMRQVRRYIESVARTDSPVLITGETGTGKELVARLIHEQSARANGPLLCVNCAAIPDSLLESELFGHDKGAFTGAQAEQRGALQAADGGTLFLDEIGDLSLLAQAKMLRSIELGSVQRLGGLRPVSVDVRIVAATNRDLAAMVRENRFRKDLYYRLNVGRVHLPPLRERPEDIWPLLEHYFQDQNKRRHSALESFPTEDVEVLMSYPWPGNVRELRNLVEAVFISSPPTHASLRYLPDPMRMEFTYASGPIQDERQRLLVALAKTHGNVSEAARTLSCSRMTLYRRIRKYHIRHADLRHHTEESAPL